MCNKTKCDKSAFQKSRRKVLKGIAAGVGALALPASNASASGLGGLLPETFP